MAISISDRLREARKNLLDLGLRNSLLNFRLTKRRGVNIVGESSKELYDILVCQGKKMSFLQAPKDNESSRNRTIESTLRDPLTDSKLQTNETAEKLQSRLLATYLDARTYLEERGVNALFLALGMLRWFESENSDRLFYAPLVLVPVSLERTDAREKFSLRYNEEDVEGNLTLSEKLRLDFGIELPSFPDQDDLDILGYFDSMAKSLSGQPRWEVCKDEIALSFFAFGKFLMFRDLDEATWPSLSKPSAHPMIVGLLGDGCKDTVPLLSEDEHLDRYWLPSESFQVADADSSQLRAILEVSKGRNLVIEGPPGTGKSQTITNLIADAVGHNKKVLFVAEKMAALQVVKRRLDNLGLGFACLELHSHNANKKAVLSELRGTTNLGKPNHVSGASDYLAYSKLRTSLNDYAEALHASLKNTGFTPYEVISELIGVEELLKGVRLPSISSLQLSEKVKADWDRSDFDRWMSLVRSYQDHLEAFGVPNRHPFTECDISVLLPAEKQELAEFFRTAVGRCDRLLESVEKLLSFAASTMQCNDVDTEHLTAAARRVSESPVTREEDVTSPRWFVDQEPLRAVLLAGKQYACLRAEYRDQIRPEAWEEDHAVTMATLKEYEKYWWRFVVGDFRRANRRIRDCCYSTKGWRIDDSCRICGELVEASRLREFVISKQADMEELFGTTFIGMGSNWDELILRAEWLAQFHADIAESRLSPIALKFLQTTHRAAELSSAIDKLETALSEYREARTRLCRALEMRGDLEARLTASSYTVQLDRLKSMLEQSDLLSDQIVHNNICKLLSDSNLQWVVDLCHEWDEASKWLCDYVKLAWFNSLIRQVLDERPILKSKVGEVRAKELEEFKHLDRELLIQNRKRLALAHWSQLPKHGIGGQAGLLYREFEKQRRLLPIRQLMSRVGNAVQAIKPVFMMSPMSVASFLPPDTVTFDLVIFDEASQVRPVDALGSICRARQTVVIGDSQQLPPTTFFESLTSDFEDYSEEEVADVTGDLESILGLARSQGISPEPVSLRWHYRSRHESLIRVSNREFYDDRLILFPSVQDRSDDQGIFFHHIKDGRYDRGRSRTNQIEATAVANRVMQHAREARSLSLGVVAFNLDQMQAIVDQLEILRRADSSCERFFSNASAEPFFVKNLESVQGDERDVMFISVGYARHSDGSPLSMSFGALNRSGGERRLNVLVTRARQRCEVFSGITWDDIDLSKSQSRGVAALQTYLRYAQTGVIDTVKSSGRGADSPFEEAVASAIRGMGYNVDLQVGTCGYFIDMAVKCPDKPGHYLIGVECDGKQYHSARTARDRDRLRQQVLEDHGWRLHRVWSTDWFVNSSGEIKKLAAAIERAQQSACSDGRNCTVVNLNLPAIAEKLDRRPQSEGVLAARKIAPYLPASLGSINRKGLPVHQMDVGCLAAAVKKVVDCEGPVHVEEICTRVACAAGAKRVSERTATVIKSAVKSLNSRGDIVRNSSFYWPRGLTKPLLRDRSKLPSSSKRLELISPEELSEAVLYVVNSAYGITVEDAAAATCRILGFAHVTPDMKTRIKPRIDTLLKQGLLVLSNGQLFSVKSK